MVDFFMCIKMERNKCDCIIERILVKPFSTRSFEEKNGRPPRLHLLVWKPKPNNVLAPFKWTLIKGIHGWLVAMKQIGCTYCFPCLLFSNEHTVWNQSGFCDLNNLTKACKRHSTECQAHYLQNWLFLLKYWNWKRVQKSTKEYIRKKNRLQRYFSAFGGFFQFCTLLNYWIRENLWYAPPLAILYFLSSLFANRRPSALTVIVHFKCPIVSTFSVCCWSSACWSVPFFLLFL
jgi:hypothetical protein